MKPNWVVLILLASTVLFAVGLVRKFSGEPPSQNTRQVIAVIPKGTGSMWWEVVRKGATQACEEEGYAILWTGPELETDREKQIQAVEDAVATGATAIVLAPNDSKALVRSIEKVAEAGLPCVIIDSAAETDRYVAFAATDNLKGGADGAHQLARAIGGKGKILLTKFVQNSASTDARAEGFRKTLAEDYPDITIVAEQYTMGTVEDARQKTVDMLLTHRDVDGLFAVNQPSSVGAYKALQSQNLAGKVKMVGFDSDPVLVGGIETGGVEALVVQNPFQIGYLGVKLVVTALRGEKVEPAFQPVSSMVVDSENLEKMKVDQPAALGL